MPCFIQTYRGFFWLAAIFCFPFFGYSQKKIVPLLADSLSSLERVSYLVDSLQDEGYLEATLEQLSYQGADSLFVARLHLGPVYQWSEVDLTDLSTELQERVHRWLLQQKQPTVRLAAWQKIREQLLAYAENNGYPLARVRLDVQSGERGQLKAAVLMDTGPRVLLDSLKIIGDTRLDPFFLQSYLGLNPGRLFRQEALNLADRRLRELPFLKVDQSATLIFQQERAQPIFYLSDRPASRFDFIIGVLPNSQQTGRLLVTADLEAELRNAFGKGERIYGHFEQLRPATQELELAIDYPYLFRLPFGTSLDFGLYKRDSAFLDLEWKIGLQYLMSGGNYLQFFWQQRQSNLLSINRSRIEQTQSLPNQLDLRQNLFGLGYRWQNLDYPFNPRRGWQIEVSAAVGNKRIRRNTSIEELGFAYLYDSLALQQFQSRLELELVRHFPLFQNSTLRLSSTGGFIISEAAIYQNEQFRLGGNQLLRGFDEEFFFARQFAVTTLEYRLLISQNSFLFTFFDAAWLNGDEPIYPYGFGAGISLETSGGMFGLSLAYGTTSGTALDLSSPKVHFGYVSLF